MIKNLTYSEKELLVILEKIAVEDCGRFKLKDLSIEDYETLRNWDKNNFVWFGWRKDRRIDPEKTHFVKLSERAWKIASLERETIARSVRIE